MNIPDTPEALLTACRIADSIADSVRVPYTLRCSQCGVTRTVQIQPAEYISNPDLTPLVRAVNATDGPDDWWGMPDDDTVLCGACGTEAGEAEG